MIDLRRLAIPGGICNDGSQKAPFRAQQSGEARLDSIFLPATVDDIEEHLQRSGTGCTPVTPKRAAASPGLSRRSSAPVLARLRLELYSIRRTLRLDCIS